jgi:predicted phosphate transport protein (TIGR00153 family)
MSFFGKDNSFFDILDKQAQATVQASEAMLALVQDMGRLNSHVEAIEAIEHMADGLTHQLANKIDSTFVTPLDNDDLHDLSTVLDDVIDFIKAGAKRMRLYRIETARPDIVPMVEVLVQATRGIEAVIATLRQMEQRQKTQPLFVRIHELENRGDDLYCQALADLFNADGADPMLVLKWKEVYDHIENAVDKCEQVASVTESVVVKYA